MAAVAAVSFGLWAVPGAGEVWHWLPHRVGLMFPSCGLTRATLLFLHGDVTRAVCFNPAAFVVLPAALAVVARWTFGRVSGRWLDIELRIPRRWAALAIVVVLALWARPQASAELLAAG